VFKREQLFHNGKLDGIPTKWLWSEALRYDHYIKFMPKAATKF
jgi:hypothetical protein